MEPIQILEGKLVIEFGINADGEQGYTIDWPQEISAGRLIAALELAKTRVVMDLLEDVEEEEPDADDDDEAPA